MTNKKKKSFKLKDHRVPERNHLSHFKGAVSYWVTRNIVLLILAFCLIAILTDSSKIKVGSKIRLNQFSHPESFQYLNDFHNGQNFFKEEEFLQYRYYYQQALGRISEPSAIKTLLAYCDYVLGDLNSSAKFYNQALAINPKIFWPFYNLGLMSYRVQKYDQAVMILKEAVGKNPHDTLSWFKESKKIYKPILENTQVNEGKLLGNLKKGYVDSYILLIASFYYQEKYQDMLAASLNALKANIGEESLFAFYAGAANYYLQNYSDAVEYLNQSVQMDLNRKMNFYYLGLSAKALGNQKLYQSTLPQWTHLPESEKSISFPTEQMKIRLY